MSIYQYYRDRVAMPRSERTRAISDIEDAGIQSAILHMARSLATMMSKKNSTSDC
jgi:ethanolamine ammonia-lyase small subunit